MLITVYKLGGPFNIKDSFTIDSKEIKKLWCDFFIQTNFCYIEIFNVITNKSSRRGYNGFIYMVKANNRGMVYDSNFEVADAERRFYLIKDFVELILDRYKYNRIE